MGIVAEIIANNTRKPLWGYKAMVYSLIFLGFMSFTVWAHHMFMTGMGTTMATFFQITTMKGSASWIKRSIGAGGSARPMHISIR